MNVTIPRLSSTEHVILELLSEGESFGLQLVERSGGRIKRGTVYVTLARMQEKGYIASRTEPLAAGAIGLPRRLYKPTAFGSRVMNAWAIAARVLNDPFPQEA